MNSLFRELAESAGWMMGDEVEGFNTRLEKFAKLLIEKCAEYVENSNCFTYASQAELCAERMKEHFGVEL